MSDESQTKIRQPATNTEYPWRKGLFVGTILVSLCGCTQITSLSPAVEGDTVAYASTVGSTQDQILLTNILRARDYEPLNLSQLSSISGALNLSGTLGFSLPFGPPPVPVGTSGSKGGMQYTATPSISASTTPTYTVTPLNTAGFTLAIIQPIAPIYIQSLMQQGFPLEVLLSLFVKEIDLSDKSGTTRYVNDPDTLAHSDAFQDLIRDLVNHGLIMKTVDVLEPVGPTFDLHVANTATVAVQYKQIFYNPITQKACLAADDKKTPELKDCVQIQPPTAQGSADS